VVAFFVRALALLATLLGSTTTTTAGGVISTYDAPAIALVDVLQIEASDACPPGLSVAAEEYAPPSAESRGSSTTPSVLGNATNTDYEGGKPIRRIYEANPKHGSTTYNDGRGREVSRQPLGTQADWQAILDCSTPNGTRHRLGVEPDTGKIVELRQHLRQEFANEIVEYYHGYVPGG
jgi:hypothetical protein